MRPRISIWGCVRPSVCTSICPYVRPSVNIKENRRKRRFELGLPVLLWFVFKAATVRGFFLRTFSSGPHPVCCYVRPSPVVFEWLNPVQLHHHSPSFTFKFSPSWTSHAILKQSPSFHFPSHQRSWLMTGVTQMSFLIPAILSLSLSWNLSKNA